ncbi:MAG: RnfABCDGE type electron transport complex subunit D [bacterium]|nr:RnfABCDGE type electron transport complex subunit D [bacterium]
MARDAPRLRIKTAPYVHTGLSTRRLMFEVVASLAPVVLCAAWYFGVSAVLVVAAATAGAVGTEWVFMDKSDGHLLGKHSLGTLRDGSALLTGVLLGLTLPPAIPLWMAFLGGFVAISLGKVIWGGLGQNLFNPALVGRAFLQAAFPITLTTWVPPGASFWDLRSGTFAAPLMNAVDGVTSATPLGLAKFEQQITPIRALLSGDTAGSLGETSGALLLICAVYLGVRKVFDWRLPLATILSVALFSGALHLIDAEIYPSPLFMLCSGGFLFGTVFMVTDPVTSPITPRGEWIFGLGVGLLVVLIRLFGGLAEGVMYAILLMNSVTPLINRVTQPRKFGG